MEEWEAMTKEVLVRLKMDIKSLVCVTATIELNEDLQGSLHHLQLSKSRRLLRSSTELMVCPDPSFLREIRVVAPLNLVNNHFLDIFLRELNMKTDNQKIQLTSSILEAALLFSITSRLSPDWNAVCHFKDSNESGKKSLLLRGSNFLVESSESPGGDAVRLRVFEADNAMWISIRAGKARLPTMRPEYLDIGPYRQVLSTPGRQIDEAKIGEPWVYVLPGLKKGRVTLLSSGLPLDADFQSYGHIQRHWTETYGFVVPFEEAPMSSLVASVKFEGTGRPSLYPLACLLRTQPVFSRHESPNTIIKRFLLAVKCIFGITQINADGQEYVAKQKLSRVAGTEATDIETESVASTSSISFRFLTSEMTETAEQKEPKMIERKAADIETESVASITSFSYGFLGCEVAEKAKQPDRQRSRLSLPKSPPCATLSNTPTVQGTLPDPVLRPQRPAKKAGLPRQKKKWRTPKKGNLSVEDHFKRGSLQEATSKQLKNWLRKRNPPFGHANSVKKEKLLDMVRAQLN